MISYSRIRLNHYSTKMIDYELAKQLKEAGFPQELLNGNKFYYLGYGDLSKLDIFCEHRGGEVFSHIKIPTLLELIEACGEKLSYIEGSFRLSRCNDCKKEGKPHWTAIGWNLKKENLEIKCGNSPEEAVAKLWLKLNENI